MFLADLHLHSTYSDGTDAPQGILQKVRRAGLAAFSLTDHDTMLGAKEMAKLARKEDGFLPGAEFSCQRANQKCHILGYGFDLNDPRLEAFFQYVSMARKDKLNRRLVYLEKEHGVRFSEEETAYLRTLPEAGKPHIASLLVKKGLANSISDGITRYFGSGTPDRRIDAKDAIAVIHQAGGVAIWAHPFGGEGEPLLTSEEWSERLRLLLAAGIDGMECFYSRYDISRCQFLEQAAKERHLLISGGSDYHGTNKSIPLGRLNTADAPIERSRLTVLTQRSEPSIS